MKKEDNFRIAYIIRHCLELEGVDGPGVFDFSFSISLYLSLFIYIYIYIYIIYKRTNRQLIPISLQIVCLICLTFPLLLQLIL